jgi:hypothetical protein
VSYVTSAGVSTNTLDLSAYPASVLT